MVEESAAAVYDIGFDYSSPCRYLQEVFRGFLRCLGLGNQGGEGKEIGGGDTGQEEGGGGGGGDGGGDGDGDGGGDGGGEGGGRDMGDSSTTSPLDQPVSATGIARRRPPSTGPISSGGPGQTN